MCGPEGPREARDPGPGAGGGRGARRGRARPGTAQAGKAAVELIGQPFQGNPRSNDPVGTFT